MPESSAYRCGALLVPSTRVRALPPATRFVLRGAPDVLERAVQALGLGFTSDPCRAVSGPERAALWLGPDERLLLGPEASGPEVTRVLGAALGDLPCSLVDVSHRQLALEASGADVEALLAVGCPLDLDVSAFPLDMCTRTMLGKAEIVLWRRGAVRFHIEVWRSFAAYVSGLLAEAERDL